MEAASNRDRSRPWHLSGALLEGAAALLALALTGCFDSDQKHALVPTTGGDSTTLASSTSPPDPWTTGQGGSVSTTESPKPTVTCRDAIDCVFGCASSLPNPPPPEPDLACLLECDAGLTEEEALLLLRLTECAAEQCTMKGLCEESGTGTGSGSSTGGSDTSTGSGGGDTGPLDPCTECILTSVLDPQPPGCLEEAANCK